MCQEKKEEGLLALGIGMMHLNKDSRSILEYIKKKKVILITAANHSIISIRKTENRKMK